MKNPQIENYTSSAVGLTFFTPLTRAQFLVRFPFMEGTIGPPPADGSQLYFVAELVPYQAVYSMFHSFFPPGDLSLLNTHRTTPYGENDVDLYEFPVSGYNFPTSLGPLVMTGFPTTWQSLLYGGKRAVFFTFFVNDGDPAYIHKAVLLTGNIIPGQSQQGV